MIFNLGWSLVALFVLSGLFLLTVEGPTFRRKHMKKERMVALRLGWIQLILSVFLSSIVVTLQFLGIGR